MPFALCLLAAIPLLIFVDGSPAIFLLAAIPDAHAYSLPASGIGGLKLVAAIALACWAVGALMRRQTFRLDISYLDVAIAGLFAVAIINITTLSDGSVGTSTLFLEYGGNLILYLFLRGAIHTFQGLRIALTAFVGSSTVAAALALWRYVHGLGAFSESLHRVSALGGDINDFAGVLLAAAGIAFVMAAHNRSLRKGLLWWTTLLVLLVAVVLSYSRQAFTGAAAMLLASVVSSRDIRLRIASLGILVTGSIIGLTGVGAVLGLSRYVNRLSNIGSLNYSATSGRNILWSMGWDAFKSHPWFGLGIGNFSSSYDWYSLATKQRTPAGFYTNRQAVHNFYLGWASDAGIVALIFLIPAIALGAWYLAKAVWKSKPESEAHTSSQGVFLAYIGFFVAQAATPTQSQQTPYLVLALAGCFGSLYGLNVGMTTETPKQGIVVWKRFARIDSAARAGVLASVLVVLGGGLAFAAHERIKSVFPEDYLPFVTCGTGSHCVHGSTDPTTAWLLPSDYDIASKALRKIESTDRVRLVWGPNMPLPQKTTASYYAAIPWAQGYCPGTVSSSGRCASHLSPSFSWLEENHPTWIEWRVNGQGQPTKPAGTQPQASNVIDFANPHARRYWFNRFVTPELRGGVDGIAWDAWDTWFDFNLSGAAGHFNKHHRFLRQYSGKLRDQRWNKAQRSALAALFGLSRTANPRVQFAIEGPLDCNNARPSVWRALLPYVNTFIDEQGYSNAGFRNQEYVPAVPGRYCINQWLYKTKLYLDLEKAHKRIAVINLERYSVTPYMTDSNVPARHDVEWALANYLLVESKDSCFWLGSLSQYGHPISIQREERANLGKPLGRMGHHWGIYVRWFTRGASLVNPSIGEPFTVNLPRGKYENMFGQHVGSVTIPPHSGLVLVTTRSVGSP